MINLLRLTYFFPLVSAVILAWPKKFNEKIITRLTAASLIFPALTSCFILCRAVSNGMFPFEHEFARFTVFGHMIPITLWFDKYTVSLLALTHILGLMVVKYSHGYLHLEKGYQRFFSTILFFIFGMYVLSMAGSIDLLFAGWEIVGFSSFLLIAFYRSHNRSVLNAWRIYNIYRICDIGLILGAVMGHILWHEATKFSVLLSLNSESFVSTTGFGMMVMSLLLIFASLGKSAQFPFYNWPSRAMEGPTPSSAIFYGALSIHAGVFLLLRTEPIWRHSVWTQLLVGVIGLVTLVLSYFQGRVQSNIKGQIAFAITGQIGLMFIELSLGLTTLAMIHMFTHALFRCFQLLVSPSIVANSLSMTNKVVMDRLGKSRKGLINLLPKKLNETLYVLSMSDFSMDISWRGFTFLPWKTVYRYSRKALKHPEFLVPAMALGIYASGVDFSLPVFLSALGLYAALRSILIQNNPFTSMLELAVGLSVSFVGVYLLEHHYFISIYSYMISVLPCLILGLGICYKFRNCDLREFHGLGTENVLYANTYFLCFMVISGMPISSAFFGEDILLEEIISRSLPMTAFVATTLMINGLLCVKIYSRLFMGRSALLRGR